MFPKGIDKLNAHTDIINPGFDKDGFYSDSNLMKKGYVKETIEESDDCITITKEFVSFDGSYRRKDSTRMSNDRFSELKSSQVSEQETKNLIQELTVKLGKEAELQNFEECGRLKTKIDTLKKLIE